MPGAYLAVDVVACLYTDPATETFARTALEAMAMRRPVVEFAVGGMGDYAINGTTALIPSSWRPESISDSLVALLRNDGMRQRLGRSARSFVVNYLDAAIWSRVLVRAYGREGERAREMHG